jgi:hypothetical protein
VKPVRNNLVWFYGFIRWCTCFWYFTRKNWASPPYLKLFLNSLFPNVFIIQSQFRLVWKGLLCSTWHVSLDFELFWFEVNWNVTRRGGWGTKRLSWVYFVAVSALRKWYCDCFENAQINAGITEFNKSKLALFKHNLLIEGWTDILLLFNCVLILIPCTLFSFTVTCIYLRVIMIHAYNFHSRSNKLSIYKTTMLHIIHGLDMISNDYEHYHVWVCLHFDVNVLF